jgi:tellurite resistance protein TehA-like permease
MENEITIFMARIIALIYIPLGVAMITGQIKGKDMVTSYEKSPVITLFVGIFAVIAGTFLVTYHNIWVKDWPVLITLLGWVAVIEGVVFIAFPKPFLKVSKKMSKNEKVWSYFALAFGLLFGYFGFLG